MVKRKEEKRGGISRNKVREKGEVKLLREAKKLSDYAVAILIVCGLNLFLVSFAEDLATGRFKFEAFFFGIQLFVGGFLIHNLIDW